MTAKGELGFIQVKHLVSALPEEGERPTKTSKRFTLEKMHMVFRTTLLMCTASQPQFSNLTITKQELDDWYDWFYGEDIAGRYPPPTETTLMYAERNAWRKIHDLVHSGEQLGSAMKSIKTGLFFWTREVYERVSKASAKGSMAKGKGKIKTTSYQPLWDKQKKGDQKGTSSKGPTLMGQAEEGRPERDVLKRWREDSSQRPEREGQGQTRLALPLGIQESKAGELLQGFSLLQDL